MAKKLDTDRPYAQIIPAQDGAHFEQDYKFFDQHGRQIVKVGSAPAEEDTPVDDPVVEPTGSDPVIEPPAPPVAEPEPTPEPETEPEPEGDTPPAIVDAHPELGPIDPGMPWQEFRETILDRFGVRISNKQEGLTILENAGLMP